MLIVKNKNCVFGLVAVPTRAQLIKRFGFLGFGLNKRIVTKDFPTK